MAITQEEKQAIINSVLSAIRTNSQTISQLTAVLSLADNDSLEVSGGKRVTFGQLKLLLPSPIRDVFHIMESDTLGDADSYLEPGLYYLTEDKSFIIVTRESDGDSGYNVTQYHFSRDALNLRECHSSPSSSDIVWSDWASILDSLDSRTSDHEEAYKVVPDNGDTPEDYTADGIYFFEEDKSVLFVKSKLVNGQTNGAYRLSIYQYSFSACGLRYRIGSVIHKVKPEESTTTEWGEWQTFDFAARSGSIDDLESAVHVIKDDKLADSDDYVEPGLYYLGEAKTHLFVTSDPLGNNVYNVRQYYFSESDLKTRQGKYRPDTNTPISWQPWKSFLDDLNKRVQDITRSIRPDQSFDVTDDVLDWRKTPGLYILANETFLLTQHGDLIDTDDDGVSHYPVVQYLFTAEGIRYRKGIYSSEAYMEDPDEDTVAWDQDWSEMNFQNIENLLGTVHLIDGSFQEADYIIHQGIYFFKSSEDCVISQRSGNAHHQYCFREDGLAFRTGTFISVTAGQKPVVNWTDWKTFGCFYDCITWEDLVAKRNAGQLSPGRWYRITDFVTTVANDPYARSAGHPFDLLVLATSPNTLTEEARAVKNDNDDYFDYSKLEAWEVWYCLDNDTKRFMWADTVNGKGVIYRLIDEFRNDCPYDFKNIQFKRYKTVGIITPDISIGEVSPYSYRYFVETYGSYVGSSDTFRFEPEAQNDFVWMFTFSFGYDDLFIGNTLHDASWTDKCLYDPESYSDCCRNNRIAPAFGEETIDSLKYNPQYLNNIVFGSAAHDMITDITIGSNCQNMTFFGYTMVLVIDSQCQHIYGINVGGVSIGADSDEIFLGIEAERISIGTSCGVISLGSTPRLINISSGSGVILVGNSANVQIGSGCNSISVLNGNTVSIGHMCDHIGLPGAMNVSIEPLCSYINAEGKNIYCSTLCEYLSIYNSPYHSKYSTVKILPGVYGTSPSDRRFINPGRPYESVCVGITASSDLKIWNPADLVY